MKWAAAIILFSISFSVDTQDGIGFLYGILGRLHPLTHGMTIQEMIILENDTTMVLQDKSIIHTGDQVQVNIGYHKDTHFYVIFMSSEGEFDLLYPGKNTMVGYGEDLPDTIYTTVLHWTEFNDPTGSEVFYLLNSNVEQNKLMNLFQNYIKVHNRGREKLAKQIKNEIDNINPENKRKLYSVGSRLDKPVLGGLTFRTGDKDELRDISLTHFCSGNSVIAFKKIVLIHK